MIRRFTRGALTVLMAWLAASWTGAAAADPLSGCASGAAPAHVVFTVSVSASGTPFVSSYVASAPTPSGNVGCAVPVDRLTPDSPAAMTSKPAGAATITVIGPGVARYPGAPVQVAPAASPGLAVPTPVNLIQVGSHLLTVPVMPGVQVYQIAPGYYVVRSTDPTQNPSVIVFPLSGTPQAPNTGPIPSVIH